MRALTLLENWVKGLKIFKRNKKPLCVKIKSFLNWIISSSYRKTAKFVSLTITKVSKSSVAEWILRIRDALKSVEWEETKKHHVVAMDETCIKLNGEKWWVFAAIDVETKELIDIIALC
jgi:transposase-like protein